VAGEAPELSRKVHEFFRKAMRIPGRNTRMLKMLRKLSSQRYLGPPTGMIERYRERRISPIANYRRLR